LPEVVAEVTVTVKTVVDETVTLYVLSVEVPEVKLTQIRLPVVNPCGVEVVIVQVVVPGTLYVPVIAELFENVTFAGVPEEVFDTTAPFKRVRVSFTAVGTPVIT
jgi:hypothetical protein